jgi:hypothetical protein
MTLLKRISSAVSALSLLAILAAAPARAQDCNSSGYVCVDAKFYRGFLGYSMLNLSFADSDTSRVSHGVDMVIDFPVVGAFVGLKDGITVYDAAYFDFYLGYMTSETLKYVKTEEGPFSVMGSFGYDFLLGYRTPAFAAFGGVRFDWHVASIGSSWLQGEGGALVASAIPLMVRGELRVYGGLRAQATAWSDFKSEGTMGVLGGLPLRDRLWIYGGYASLGGHTEKSWNDTNAKGSTDQISIGLRFGKFY